MDAARSRNLLLLSKVPSSEEPSSESFSKIFPFFLFFLPSSASSPLFFGSFFLGTTEVYSTDFCSERGSPPPS